MSDHQEYPDIYEPDPRSPGHLLLIGTFWRRARKAHRCFHCGQPIVRGEEYLEYLGESSAYESGKRFHVVCAAGRHGIRVPC